MDAIFEKVSPVDKEEFQKNRKEFMDAKEEIKKQINDEMLEVIDAIQENNDDRQNCKRCS